MSLNEAIVEEAALSWFDELGYAIGTGPDIAPGEPASERTSFADVILVGRLQDAIQRLNPLIPQEAQEEALRKVVRLDTASFIGNNRAIATHEVIEELIRLAKEMEAAQKRGEELGLTDDEIAFYDALATNESALTAMGDDKLKVIAAELIKMVRKSVTIDWTLRETARAKIRVIVKRILNKWGYPSDLQEEAVKTVLQQAELLCADWSGNDK